MQSFLPQIYLLTPINHLNSGNHQSSFHFSTNPAIGLLVIQKFGTILFGIVQWDGARVGYRQYGPRVDLTAVQPQQQQQQHQQS